MNLTKFQDQGDFLIPSQTDLTQILSGLYPPQDISPVSATRELCVGLFQDLGKTNNKHFNAEMFDQLLIGGKCLVTKNTQEACHLLCGSS